MGLLADIAVILVALLHAGFMALEMFFWDKPAGRRIFGLSEEFARASKALAANQGLYNGFLAGGLAWGLLQGTDGFATLVYFLACVIIAGIFGAATASPRILWIQALPGGAALVLTLLARG